MAAVPAGPLIRLSSAASSRAIAYGDTGDKDPQGLTVVHRPDGDRTADIVFVHGLGGGSQRTWSKDHNPDFFWPQRFLPAEPGISDTRISTFGYDSNFKAGSKNSHRVSILDFAKSLLFHLKYTQDEFMGQQEDLGMGEVNPNLDLCTLFSLLTPETSC
ncbi:hypothetical protein IMZ48_32205 [Candidatus Bathyarchaeota archaeon]|nr:hypothetical protein [Candidatus Bathyarchaeota archaeon]